MTPASVLLGAGRLTWSPVERQSDRYGAVWLMPDREECNSLSPGPFPSCILETAQKLENQHGTLYAEIKAVRTSTHVGDLARGFSPETPEIGEKITLGTGFLFTGIIPKTGLTVGIRPTYGRPKDWLEPRALYRCHEQTLGLFFKPL